MRMGAFLLGGLVGAAAVIYFQNNRNSMMFSTMNNATNSLDKIVDKGKQLFGMNNNQQKSQSVSSNHKSQAGSAKSLDSKADLDKVGEIVKQGSNVEQKVDEILSENNLKSAYQSH